jgi:signal transduction histidine kinase
MRHHRVVPFIPGRRLAWSAAALAYGLIALAVGLAVTNGPAFRDPQLAGSFAQAVVPSFAIAFVGALLASRLPRNAVGWVLLAGALINSFQGLMLQYEIHTLLVARGSLPGVEWVAWLGSLVGGLVFPGFIVALLLLFPDGRLPSRSWWVLLWIDVAVTVLNGLIGIVDPMPILSAGFPAVANPTGLALFSGFATGPVGWVDFLLIIMLPIAATALLVVRLVRARGEARQQLRWVVYVLAVGITLNALMALSTFVIPPSPAGRVIGNVISNGLVVGAFGIALPAAIGVAILKYRLYDIDLVINRTLVYGTLAAFITAVYVGIVVGIGGFVGSGTRPNLALSIVATAVVAVAFQPVREAVQRFANRLVYGRRASPYEVMAGFADRMAGTLSVDEVLPQMAEAAARGVGAPAARVTLLVPDGGDRSTVWPTDADAGPFTRILPVSYRGEPVGEIAVRESPGQSITPAEGRLLADLAAQAGLVLHNVRLTAELQARLADISAQAVELRASRQRIVAAQETERRRLGGEIRAGVQRELEATSQQLDEVEQLLGDDGATAAARLEALTTETQRTLDGLRELARGIFPPLLADKGIVAALQAHARKTAIPASIDISDDLAATRFDPGVEAAVYFCCTEALRAVNGPAAVHLKASEGVLTFTIDGAAALNGRLEGLRDRVEALGGSLEEDGPGLLRGRVPTRPMVAVG